MVSGVTLRARRTIFEPPQIYPMRTIRSRYLASLFSALCVLPPAFAASGTTIDIASPMPPPGWAKLERQILADSVPAAREFAEKYYDDRGYFRVFARWGANDGPDDAFENFA